MRTTIAIVIGLLVTATAQAQPEETPWSQGVSAAQKATAQARLEEGNALFLEGKHREALEQYQAAIAAWDHPAIRFNVVRALIVLDRPVEAFDNLEQALRYGSAPLEEQVFAEAENYRRLLLGQIAELEVTCTQQGAEISVDGQKFVSCPGAHSSRLLPGTHQIVAKNTGYMPLTQEVIVLPGKKESVAIKMVSLEDATVTRRRWKTWKPWAVVGGGAALAAIGGLLQLKATSDLDQYESELASECAEVGCGPGDLPASTSNLADNAILYNRIAISTIVTGGALVVAGLTMVILNSPKAVLPESGPTLTPTINSDGVGFLYSGSF